MAAPMVLRPDAKRASRPECIALNIAPQSLSASVPVHIASVVTLPSTEVAGARALTAAARSTQFTEGDVVGLIPDLQVRAVKGPGFASSRAAIINDTGAIEAAVGDPNACLQVSGASLACGGVVPAFVDAETPSGTIDGANAVFTIKGVPSPFTSLALYRNGLLQSVGADYYLSTNVITFVPLATPQAGDILVAKYRQ